ncbi:hypothetical protein T265_01239 [Opisthorchis viverrini]|uniref:Uncharacterized protein n=1 Tax=Opisthorchis viverrini TaxID=6198 RepID=A0A074ZZ89_OPIVI|nr:hypothetical protein T265_01239 [Opisthorchis viverrini]KER32753.1 hypothetical protein T265_01239 [Opisthorchis viverrini]
MSLSLDLVLDVGNKIERLKTVPTLNIIPPLFSNSIETLHTAHNVAENYSTEHDQFRPLLESPEYEEGVEKSSPPPRASASRLSLTSANMGKTFDLALNGKISSSPLSAGRNSALVQFNSQSHRKVIPAFPQKQAHGCMEIR